MLTINGTTYAKIQLSSASDLRTQGLPTLAKDMADNGATHMVWLKRPRGRTVFISYLKANGWDAPVKVY